MKINALTMQAVNWPALGESVRMLARANVDPKGPLALLFVFGDVARAQDNGDTKFVHVGLLIDEDPTKFTANSQLVVHPGEQWIVMGRVYDFIEQIIALSIKENSAIRLANAFYTFFYNMPEGDKLFQQYSRIQQDGYFLLKRRCI